MSQVQVTKPKTATKTAAKSAGKSSVKSKAPQKSKPLFCIHVGSRPDHGRLLYAHTHAAMVALGMLTPQRPAVPKSRLCGMVGDRAVSYHLREHNLEKSAGDGVRLTPAGIATFNSRLEDGRVDSADVDAFLKVMRTGDGSAVGLSDKFVHKLGD